MTPEEYKKKLEIIAELKKRGRDISSYLPKIKEWKAMVETPMTRSEAWGRGSLREATLGAATKVAPYARKAIETAVIDPIAKGVSLITGKEVPKSQTLREMKEEEKRKEQKAKTEYPGTYTAGGIASAVAMPVPGGKVKGVAGALLRRAVPAAMAATQGAIEAEEGERLKQAAAYGGTSLLMGEAIRTGVKGARLLKEPLEDAGGYWLRKLLPRKPAGEVIKKFGPEGMKEVGKVASSIYGGQPRIPFKNKTKVVEILDVARQRIGRELDDFYAALDEAQPAGFYKQDLISAMMENINKTKKGSKIFKYRKGTAKTQYNKIKRVVSDIVGGIESDPSGQIKTRQIHNYMSDMNQFLEGTKEADVPYKLARKALKDVIFERVEKGGPEVQKIGKDILEKTDMYARLIPFTKQLKNMQTDDETFKGLLKTIVFMGGGGAIGGGGSYLFGKTELTPLVIATVSAAAAGAAKRYGKQVISYSLQRASNILSRQPKNLGPFGLLLREAAKAGRDKFVLMHFALMDHPEYNKLVTEGISKAKEKVKTHFPSEQEIENLPIPDFAKAQMRSYTE